MVDPNGSPAVSKTLTATPEIPVPVVWLITWPEIDSLDWASAVVAEPNSQHAPAPAASRPNFARVRISTMPSLRGNQPSTVPVGGPDVPADPVASRTIRDRPALCGLIRYQV